MKDGEVVLRLIAYKTVKCKECEGYIYPGQTFLLDLIPYVDACGNFKRGRRINHKIHEWHWKGSPSDIIDRTRAKWRPKGAKTSL